MRKRAVLAAGTVASLTLLGTGIAPAAGTPDKNDATTTYTVLMAEGADRAAALEAIREAGGRVTAENRAIHSFTVTAPDEGFIAKVSASGAVYGATRQRPVGYVPKGKRAPADRDTVEKEHLAAARAGQLPSQAGRRGPRGAGAGLDPLDDKLWGLKMIRADLARKVQAGDKRVLVGVIDTGIDGTHPDLAPNFNAKLSRNFTTDIPTDPKGNEIDGPCEFAGCKDPNNWDDDGHGTHVAGTIAAAANGFGVSGVAPKVSLVNLRAGQDSGFFFLEPVVNALTYGADVGVDVVNMSFYVDPWAYNCLNNEADPVEARIEQRTIIAAMFRALSYAHAKGVTLVGALGNNHEDLGKPRTDTSSPDYPLDSAYPRPIDNHTCWDLPVEGPHVIGVSALGPSGRKSDFSNYGVEQISVAAPGGWFRDFFGTPRHRTNENMILSTAPRNALQHAGLVDDQGEITPDGQTVGVTKQCLPDGRCGYYQWLQGTSMASPHAAGVAALIVSAYGTKDPRHPGGLRLAPWQTERILTDTAAERACPEPRLVTYTDEGRDAEWNAYCEGDAEFNGFYGHGIVDAYAAITARGR
ncbi:S8 family serine peptidase [Carbonactinospora thermoautotrophica]|uniref:S8 family serine peptidase n=1 Tax=Carbonactinospora thermoautotrophica TaxID=1469144 RepID=UPI0027E04E84|nr:S8 family serine peptidase [Carbonactinospora thermoautotrophica]